MADTPSFVRILFIVGLRTSIDLKTASLQFIFLEIESACVKNDSVKDYMKVKVKLLSRV